MKRIFVSLSFMLVVGSTSVFAGDKTDVSGKIKESFKKEFAGADFVKWDAVENYQRATFLFHDHPVIAFFDEDGELLGSARNVFYDQLPLTVIKSFDKRFAGAEFLEMYEISNIDGTSYGITFETANKRYHVKVNTEGNFLSSVTIK
jgi:hypothetical protein